MSCPRILHDSFWNSCRDSTWNSFQNHSQSLTCLLSTGIFPEFLLANLPGFLYKIWLRCLLEVSPPKCLVREEWQDFTRESSRRRPWKQFREHLEDIFWEDREDTKKKIREMLRESPKQIHRSTARAVSEENLHKLWLNSERNLGGCWRKNRN